ncbi:hypothetical protein PYCCODRAFT_1429660 [Trametes coccinea BRFM310]|uniref:Uncharacterized protein n=1 Tax=Trametes coccinea (strain BRFM310) TaxID=1353009 RepID=A0A1Y2J725_TRAC3|nr:hypothetical protein PYCCODRAFT_1429659 [Trametes coccinea BRFM310]OSD08605.1 hypothetical protein PYCCODRAFT_1429660 [Trametes coccinea BRFM310]
MTSSSDRPLCSREPYKGMSSSQPLGPSHPSSLSLLPRARLYAVFPLCTPPHHSAIPSREYGLKLSNADS